MKEGAFMDFLLILAIILLSTKLFGIISQRVNLPSVVGALVAGLLLGPACFNIVSESDFIMKLAEIGVIMLMFLAGLDTDIEELKKTGVASLVIALIGVIVPLAGGYVAYMCFYDTSDMLGIIKGIFVGVVLTATSVSITVETLREMGKLKGRMGTAILGAAIIDDIIGIVVLTVVIGMKDPSANLGFVLLKILGFFVFSVVVGFLCYLLFKHLHKKHGEKRRVAIYGFAFCLLMSYIAEHFFGVADITGAYFAGIILCQIGAKEYIAKKINVASYMLCAPVFFASIGIKTSFAGFTPAIATFSVILLAIAILSKIIGCGLGAKICKFSWRDSLCIGVGMVSRGEVALIVTQKGEQANLLDQSLFPAAVLVVIVTTLITPILLKLVIPKNEQALRQAHTLNG